MIHKFSQFSDINVGPGTSIKSDIDIENPLYQVHNNESADIAMASRVAREMVNINGANVMIHARTENHDLNNVHDEDPDPTYLAPVFLKGYFVPKPLEYEMTLWGVDTKNTTEIIFCRSDVYVIFNSRLLTTGDIIELPYNSVAKQTPKYYRVDNAQEFGNFRYNWLYLKCQLTLITGEVNIRPANDDAI